MLTRSQQGTFQPIKRDAWLVRCQDTGTAPNNKAALDAWYRGHLVSGVGVHSTKEIKTREKYELLMFHFSLLAGNEKQSNYWGKASERRLIWLIDDRLAKLHVNRQYAFGIAKQMGFDDCPFSDLPTQHLHRIFIALDKELKRSSSRSLKQGASHDDSVPF